MQATVSTIDLVIEDLMGIYTGLQFGYFDHLAECGPMTATELARKTGASPEAMREWLERQEAAGLVVSEGRAYRLADGRADLLVTTDGPSISHYAKTPLRFRRGAAGWPLVG